MTSDLIDRLSKLDGKSRHGLTGKELYDICRHQLGSDEALGLSRTLEKALNGSVDAAIALAERVLPDVAREIVSEAMSEIMVTNQKLSRLACEIVIAILRAKEAKN
jgi:hypothetical protein